MSTLRTFRPALDTSAYADGDILFQPVQLQGVTPFAKVPVELRYVGVVDRDDQGAAFDLLFFTDNATLGTINVAPTISDNSAMSWRGRVQIAAADYYDLGGVRVASVPQSNLWQLLFSGDDSSDLYVAGISRGTGTYTQQGLQISLGFAWRNARF